MERRVNEKDIIGGNVSFNLFKSFTDKLSIATLKFSILLVFRKGRLILNIHL